MSPFSTPQTRILPILVLCWASAHSADTTRTVVRPMQSLLLLRTRSSAVAPAPLLAQMNLPSVPESWQPNPIPAQVTPAPALPYSGSHLEGIPRWNWDSPYAQGTGTWSRSYAENAMQGHEDPNRSHRNWIFGLR